MLGKGKDTENKSECLGLSGDIFSPSVSFNILLFAPPQVLYGMLALIGLDKECKITEVV